MTRRSVVVGVVFLVMFAVIVRDYYRHPPVLKAYDSLVVSKPAADSVINEHGDSAKARLKIVYVQQDRSDVLVLAAKLSDSLSQLAIVSHDFELAYRYQKERADTLELAVAVARDAIDNALSAAAFRELQFMADSIRRFEEWQVTQQLAVAVKPKWYKRCGLMAGVGTRGPDVMVGCKVYP